MNAQAPAQIEWHPYSYELAIKPFAVFKRLRDEMPLYRNEEYDFYAMSRYQDCVNGLADKDTYSSSKGGILEIIKAGFPTPPGFFISNDPPVHTVYRKLLALTFTPKRMAQLEVNIRGFCARTLDPLIGSGGFDFVKDFSAKVPMKVIGMLMGIPEEDQEAVRQKAEQRLRTEVGKPMASDQYGSAVEHFNEYIEFRVKHPSDDLMSELVHTEFEDEKGVRRKLSSDERRNIISMLAAAGNETTNKLIGWTGKLLAAHPEQRREIVRNRELIPQAIEEILRCEPPAGHIARYVTRDVQAYGKTVPAGSAMIFLTGAANRDERQFENAEAFNIHRERKPHLSFGHGLHVCLGNALARIEGRIALDEVLKRFPDWEVNESKARLIPTSTVRGWETLPVTIN